MLYCVNCGNSYEDGDRFCAFCGYILRNRPIPPQPPAPEVVSESVPSRPVEFISPSPRCRAPPLHHHHPRPRSGGNSGLILGCFFIIFGLLLGAMFLGYCFADDFGCTFGSLGGDFGDLGEAFGEFGSELGEAFGEFGEDFGNDFNHDFSFGPRFRSFFFVLVPFFFIIPGILLIIFFKRRNRYSSS